MVSDVKKFINHTQTEAVKGINNFGIDSQPYKFDREKIKHNYIECMLMEATEMILDFKHPKIVEERIAKEEGSLPKTFFPFELGVNSDEFKKA